MKRVSLVIPVFVLAVTPLAYAAGEWDHSGGTVGRFGSAEEACKDLIGTGTAYEFAKVTPPDARGYSECYTKAKDKGNSKEEPTPIKQGLVYKVEKPQPAPTSTSTSKPPPTSKPAPTTATTSKSPPLNEGCDASMVAGWFPTWKGSPLEAAGAGIEPIPNIGACFTETETKGPRMFVNSKGTVRADRMYKGADGGKTNHYHLRVGNLIVDNTIFQFFQRKSGFNGLVFVGTEAQLLSTLDKLVSQCGINRETQETLDKSQTGDPVRGKSYRFEHLFGKSGQQLKASLFDGATVKNSGACLKMRPSGTNADYQSNCTSSAGSGKTIP